jgi:CRISPR-associated protein Cas2
MSYQQYLVCYDIANKKRLARVRKIVYSYALSGQKSALEAPLSKNLLNELIEKLNRVIDKEVDRINIIPFTNAPLIFGKGKYFDSNTGVLII